MGKVLNDFDVFAIAGHKSAVLKSFDCIANNAGTIVINFLAGSADHPFISGLEVLALNLPPTPPTPSPPTPPPPPPTPTPPTPPPTPSSRNKTVISINAGGNAADFNFVKDTDFDQGTEFIDASSPI